MPEEHGDRAVQLKAFTFHGNAAFMAMQPVLILGGGVNGAALAREFVLNGLDVRLVDTADIASGASAASSRLIHGGLRYLEHGEFALVRESLTERARLLRLAPHYVHPLELFIPLKNRFGGLRQSAWRFLGLSRDGPTRSRGLWLVRLGLWLYRRWARDPAMSTRGVYGVGDARAPAVDGSRYRWQCSYRDAMVPLAERLIVALLQDAKEEARRRGATFEVYNYHRAIMNGNCVEVRAVGDADTSSPPVAQWSPAAIINATGAWVDETLQRLAVDSPRLMGGTKGSHFFTLHAGLRQAISGRGVYAEADDGRPVFVLPLEGGSLVGTTDLRFDESPEKAVASDEELDYLISTVNEVFADLQLTHRDIDWHCSGVRPLPYADESRPGSITRRHRLHEHTNCPMPFFSIIGGKLTTCRALAEDTVQVVLDRLGVKVVGDSRDRVIPGGEDYPADDQVLKQEQSQLAREFGLEVENIKAVWRLFGARTKPVLAACQPVAGDVLAATELPTAVVRWVIENEWAFTVDDLVSRRLMLWAAPCLHDKTLRHLATLLAESGRIEPGEIDDHVARTVRTLAERNGKQVAGHTNDGPSSPRDSRAL